jgi:hypothetical protein
MPTWLHVTATVSLAVAGVSFLAIVGDILAGHRQHMWIMNVVWPLTALWAGPLAVWFYWRVGRLSAHERVRAAKARGEAPPGKRKPWWQTTGVAATHCGSGCCLGDIVAEWLVFAVPVTLFGMTLFAAWAIDYAFAFLFGIAFQYFTIVPMRGLSPGRGLVAAVKADALSLTSWQLGMYGWMALVVFVFFGHELHKTSPVFWFMMQLAMLAGFATSYPVNAWLLRRGLKEQM